MERLAGITILQSGPELSVNSIRKKNKAAMPDNIAAYFYKNFLVQSRLFNSNSAISNIKNNFSNCRSLHRIPFFVADI